MSLKDYSGFESTRIVRIEGMWACLLDEFFVVKDGKVFRPATRSRDPLFCAYRTGKPIEGPIGFERAEDAEKVVKALNEAVGNNGWC